MRPAPIPSGKGKAKAKKSAHKVQRGDVPDDAQSMKVRTVLSYE